MHIDARYLESSSQLEADLCIIGAGAAGISIALQFLNSSKKVLLLEAGGFEYEERMQDLYAGTTSGQRYFPLRSIRLNYFGGTTGHWAGFCAPFDDIDFQKRDWVPHSGWPISKKELDPYYARAHDILDLGPYNYEANFWMRQDPSLKPLPFDEQKVWNKMWQFSPPTRFGTKYKETILQSRNIQLVTYASVTTIVASENVREIREVKIANYTGKVHSVKAKQYVLACCAIQNARLLLASNRQAPKGLGNDHDLVGRFFMEHIEIKASELWMAKPQLLKFYLWESQITKARAELAISPKLQEQFQILNGTASLNPLQKVKDQKAFIDNWEDEKGNGMARQMREDHTPRQASSKASDPEQEAYQSFQLFTRIEQAPNPDSRITLGDQSDELGVRRAHLHWVLTPLEKRSIRKIHELIGNEAGKADVARVRLLEYLQDQQDDSWPNFTGGGWHHMGTTRMSDDAHTGVVDAHCKVYGLSNLYVAGSSCFVTAAAPNPTLTIIALSLRLADEVKKKL